MMVQYPTGLLPCPPRDSYSLTRVAATTSLPYLKGRPTHILKDLYPVSEARFTMLMSHAQFIGWQDFWTHQINAGADWFEWDGLYIDAAPELVTCHATEQFTAQGAQNRNWAVGLALECYAGTP